MIARARKGQLLRDGRLGEPSMGNIIDAGVVVDYLLRTGDNAKVTIGQRYRHPRVYDRELDNINAIRFVRECAGKYFFEAYCTGDGFLYVTALSENDLI